MLFLNVERRTRLVCELVVSVDCGTGVFLPHLGHESHECGTLRRSACVFGRIIPVGILRGSAASDVAYSDGMWVVARGVCADLVFRAATVNGAVTVYHIVIADIGEASCKMPLADLGDGIILPLRRSRTMEDYLVDAASVR